MALCPLAIASKGNANDGTGDYYFALDVPNTTTVVAPAFTATGIGQPGDDGRFVARGDAAAGAPALAFQMRTSGVSALQQWNIGMTDAPAGANSGNNFAIVAYDDASNPLSVPLSINRATGAIEMSDSLTVGYGTEVLGANLQVNGTAGLSRVYDPVYNPPQTGADVLLFSAPADGVTPITANTYTPVRSGLHILSLTVTANAAGFAWTPGATALLYGLTYNGGANIEAGGQLYCPLITNPAGMPAIGPLGPNLVEYQNDILVNLTAGRVYAIAAASSGAPNLGASGNVGVIIQPVYA